MILWAFLFAVLTLTPSPSPSGRGEHGSASLTIPFGQSDLPTFEIYVECISRGPYPGRAEAQLSYRYDGAFPIQAEDSRYYGDIGIGNVQIMPFVVEPGEHRKFTQVSVGAFKVVVWKVVFMDELHVLMIWDDPSVGDCAWDEPEPTPTPDERGRA